MTDHAKIRMYYKEFNEWGRLDTYPGQLELKIVLEIISNHLTPCASIFDLGGGAGRYTFELTKRGYQMHLADLSPDLISIAKDKLSDLKKTGIVKSIKVASAVNLSMIKDGTYENILLFGVQH